MNTPSEEKQLRRAFIVCAKIVIRAMEEGATIEDFRAWLPMLEYWRRDIPLEVQAVPPAVPMNAKAIRSGEAA